MIDRSFRVAPVTDVVDDAVGMGKSQWYVAIVQHNTEKSCAKKMNKIGIQTYVPIQAEYRIWKNGRKAKVDRVVIPSTIFIKCTESERLEIVKLPFINRFMTNKAGIIKNSINKPLAIIPENEIKLLIFMLGQSDIAVEITKKPFKTGDEVRVIRGALAGLVGEVMNLKKAKSELVISFNSFGCARLYIETNNLELI